MGGGGSGEESVVAVLNENAIGPRPALILFCSWLRTGVDEGGFSWSQGDRIYGPS